MALVYLSGTDKSSDSLDLLSIGWLVALLCERIEGLLALANVQECNGVAE